MSRTGTIAIILGLSTMLGLAILTSTHKPKPQVVGYPLVGMYSHMLTTGDPFVIDGRHGGTEIDTAACRYQARYDFVIIDPERRDVLGRKVLGLIRGFNPRATMLAYLNAGSFFVCGPDWHGQVPPYYGCDTTTCSWAQWQVVRAFGAELYNRSGATLQGSGGILVNFAAPGFSAAWADSFAAWVVGSGVYSPGGAFTDGPCTSIVGFYPGNQVDYQRAGFPTIAAFDAAYQQGVLAFRKRLKTAGLEIGNCGPSGPLMCNGWLGENFPHQPPVGWAAWDTVLAHADLDYAAPRISFISTMRQGRLPEDPTLQRDLRFGLASATMHDHVCSVLVGSTFDDLRGFVPDLWADEYSVTPAGLATGDDSYKGWLGQPTGAAKVVGTARLRLFKHGAAMLNPPEGRTAKVFVGEGYYRITGTNPVNSGAAASVVYIEPGDGLFLIKR